MFELSPPAGKSRQWTESVLWSFGIDDGQYPTGSLIFDKWGNLYGTTWAGGSTAVLPSQGTVFELSPPVGQPRLWRESVLWSFIPLTIDFELTGDGQGPYASLIFDKWGNLYGTTSGGGTISRDAGGTVFEVSPPTRKQTQWSERVLWSFGAAGDGISPLCSA